MSKCLSLRALAAPARRGLPVDKRELVAGALLSHTTRSEFAARDNAAYRAIRSARLSTVDAAINSGKPRTEWVVPEWRDTDWIARDDPRTDTTARFEFRTPKHATGTVKHVYRRGRFVGTIRRIPEGWTSDAAPGVVVKDRLELAQSLLALKRGAAMPTLDTVQPAPKPAPQPIKPRGALMSTERINRHVTNYPNMPRFGADI